MQVGVGIHQRQRQFDGRAHAHLVDVAHVEHFDVLFVHKTFLAFVHTADANLAYPFGRNGGYLAAYLDQLLGTMAAQAGHRHSVDVAAGRERVGVEVGMGVQPEDAQLFAGVAAVAGHGADGPNTQAVVAAQQNGQAAIGQFGIHRIVHGLVPVRDLGQMAVAVHWRQPGVAGANHVAFVDDVQALGRQHVGDIGHAQGLRPHAGAAAASTNVGGGAYQADFCILHGCCSVCLWRLQCKSGAACTDLDAAYIDDGCVAPGVQRRTLGVVQPAQLLHDLDTGRKQRGLVGVDDL